MFQNSMTEEGNVEVCPVTKETWEARAEAKKADCGGQSVYHCLSDSKGRKWEKCVQRTLVIEGYCPIFTSDGYIDWKQCNISEPTCPNSSYVSDEVYKHSRCFGNNTATKQTENLSGPRSLTPGMIIGVTCALVGMLILAGTVAVILHVKHRRTRKGHASNEDTELKTLLQHTDSIPREEIMEVTNSAHCPDGISEEVVKEQNVYNGLSALNRKNVKSIVVLGSFGNAVSSTSRRILEEVVEKMESWRSHQCRYTEIPDTVAENTIMFVYGWFGYWNDDLCSVDEVKAACTKLERILNEPKTVKVIIGMRSDLHKDYHRELKEFKLLFKSEINLDGENLCTDAEYSRFFKKHVTDSCGREECSCKKLTFETLRDGNDTDVGMPLKIKIIGNYHEMVSQYIKNKDILKVTKDHITALGRNKEMKHVYKWMKYICLKGRFSRSDEFEKDLVEDLKRSSFNEKDTKLQKYIRMRNSDQQRNVSSQDAQYVFWHPFIYICVFHSLFEQDSDHVMMHCNLDAIFQLVRPKGTKTSYIEVSLNDQSVNLFKERLSRVGLPEKYKNHPLVKISTSTCK